MTRKIIDAPEISDTERRRRLAKVYHFILQMKIPEPSPPIADERNQSQPIPEAKSVNIPREPFVTSQKDEGVNNE